MNNRGFTLIELIATISLLAVISVISFVSINAVIEENKISNCENLVKSIKNAAKEYVSDNRYNINAGSMDDKTISDDGVVKYIVVTAEDLMYENYLSDSMVDPFDNDISLSIDQIEGIVVLNDDYSAKNVTIRYNGIDVNCSNGTF